MLGGEMEWERGDRKESCVMYNQPCSSCSSCVLSPDLPRLFLDVAAVDVVRLLLTNTYCPLIPISVAHRGSQRFRNVRIMIIIYYDYYYGFQCKRLELERREAQGKYSLLLLLLPWQNCLEVPPTVGINYWAAQRGTVAVGFPRRNRWEFATGRIGSGTL